MPAAYARHEDRARSASFRAFERRGRSTEERDDRNPQQARQRMLTPLGEWRALRAEARVPSSDVEWMAQYPERQNRFTDAYAYYVVRKPTK